MAGGHNAVVMVIAVRAQREHITAQTILHLRASLCYATFCHLLRFCLPYVWKFGSWQCLCFNFLYFVANYNFPLFVHDFCCKFLKIEAKNLQTCRVRFFALKISHFLSYFLQFLCLKGEKYVKMYRMNLTKWFKICCFPI